MLKPLKWEYRVTVQGHCTGTGTEVATAWRMTKQKLQIARGALS